MILEMKRRMKYTALVLFFLIPFAYYLSMQKNQNLRPKTKIYKVPILCYHNLNPKTTKGRYTITPELFEKHLKGLDE